MRQRALASLAAALGIAGAAHAASPYADTTFGVEGVTVVDRVANSHSGIPLQLADGKIALLFDTVRDIPNLAQGTVFYLARLQRNGALDTSFGDRGISPVSNHFGPEDLNPTGIFEDSSRRLIVVGQRADSAGNNLAGVVKRFSADGLPDLSFGSVGTLDLSAFREPDAFVVSFASYRSIGGGRNMIVIRYGRSTADGSSASTGLILLLRDDGTFDRTFAGTGGLRLDFTPSAVKVEGDGSLFATGVRFLASPDRAEFVTTRITAAGSMAVPTVTETIAGPPITYFQEDGSYITMYPARDRMEVRDASGRLDPLFGNGGITTESTAGVRGFLARTPDGGVVTGMSNGSVVSVCAWRVDGHVESCGVPIPGFSFLASLPYVGPDGSLYLSTNTTTDSFAAARAVRLGRFTVAAPNVEYVNSTSKHYFVTYDGAEARLIDQGAAGAGWTRTGSRFKAGGTTPVCRFYGTPGIGSNSHFFTISAQECELVKKDSGWTFEGYGFYATPAVNGACEAPLAPVHRLYNNRAAQRDSNHRHITDLSLRASMESGGWSYEGVAFCVRP